MKYFIDDQNTPKLCRNARKKRRHVSTTTELKPWPKFRAEYVPSGLPILDMATMAESVPYSNLRNIFNCCAAMDYSEYCKRWLLTKMAAHIDRWLIRGCLDSIMCMAYITTYASFHKTNTPTTNYTDLMDGANICSECGNNNNDMLRLRI